MPQQRRAARSVALGATLLLGAALAVPAAAATVTTDQAQAVERELHDWLQAMLGGTALPGDRAVQLVPEGGDYALLIPLGADTAITGHLAPQDDGRWLLSDVKLPSPASFTRDVPAPAQEGQAATATRTYQFSVARQQINGTFDPSYKTASSLQHRFDDVQLSSSGGGWRQMSQAAHAAGQSTLTPAADGRLDLASESTLDSYVIDTQKEGGGSAIHVTADRGRILSQVSGVSPDRGPAVLRDVIGVVGAQILPALSKGGPRRLTAEQRAQLRGLVDALDGFASGLQADDALEGVQVQAGAITGVAQRMRLGFGGNAADSVLKAYLDLGVEGLSIPGLPVGPYADLIPTEIHLRPTLAGIGTKELLGLARQALDAADQGQAAPPDPEPLFAHGGVIIGLDAVSFNVGPTVFTGHGAVIATAPGEYNGGGQVMATDFDALMDRAKRDPAMQGVLAALTVAKGISRTDGDQLVWDITYQDGKALVNGVDVMAMAGPVRVRPSPAPPVPSPSAKPPPKQY